MVHVLRVLLTLLLFLEDECFDYVKEFLRNVGPGDQDLKCLFGEVKIDSK